MTRKDYELLAVAIAEGIQEGDVLKSIADALARDNPAFDRGKFFDYIQKRIEA